MARVVALVPDLLFGSNVVGGLRAAGHEPVLVSRVQDVGPALGGAQVLVVDLTADAAPRIEALAPLIGTVATLAFYSHVEADVRTAATEAGFDLVVPRSRMARAMGELVTELVG